MYHHINKNNDYGWHLKRTHVSKTPDELILNTSKRFKLDYEKIINPDISFNSQLKNKLQPFKSFNHQDIYGIPERLAKLANTEIQDIIDFLPQYTTEYRTDVTLVDFCHVHQYLSAKEFNISLLSDTTYDSVINAIVSYLLDWPNEKLNEFVALYPMYENFCTSLEEIRSLNNGKGIYNYNGIPVIGSAIKLIKSHLIPKTLGKKYFHWVSLFNYDFIKHLNMVYDWLCNDNIDAEKIAILEQDDLLPYKLPHIDVTTLKQYNDKHVSKFISGQACCCKTTIINRLTKLGWKKYSRGDIGSFSGKSNSPAAISNLYAALAHVLTLPDVIGDRGFIDNLLWSFIMPACNPKYKKDLVSNLLSFLDANFNEPSIAFFIAHKGVIFIDPKPKKNKERQLKRCEDGDPWRSRLAMYTISQFMAYYTIAKLFGWKVICVPYTADGEIDNIQYEKNVEKIIAFFGMPNSTGIPYNRYTRPSNLYTYHNLYPEIVGIFK